MVLDVDYQRDVTSIMCFSLMWFHFSLNIQGIFSSRITCGLTVLFLLRTFLQANGIHVLDWPALSPHLAPIEHLWDEFGRHIHNRRRQPTNVNELQAALHQEWLNMLQAFINRLVNSMRHRCTAIRCIHWLAIFTYKNCLLNTTVALLKLEFQHFP